MGHRGRDFLFAGQYFIDLGLASNNGYKVAGAQSLLIHTKFNGP